MIFPFLLPFKKVGTCNPGNDKEEVLRKNTVMHSRSSIFIVGRALLVAFASASTA